IAAVEGGDADAGPLGHLGDRGGRGGDEHRARGVQDQLVVAGRLGLPARKRRGGTRRGITRHGPIVADQNVLFCWVGLGRSWLIGGISRAVPEWPGGVREGRARPTPPRPHTPTTSLPHLSD